MRRLRGLGRFAYERHLALRRGDWKIVGRIAEGAPAGDVELCELAHDAGESANLAETHTGVAARLLETWRRLDSHFAAVPSRARYASLPSGDYFSGPPSPARSVIVY